MDLASWLQDLGLERYAETFRDHEVDLDVLSELTEGDLEKLGIPLGHRKKLLRGIVRLRESGAPVPAGLPRAEAERRQLTVMFVDLVGSTELSTHLDPEDMSALIRAFQECCASIVKRWGGRLAKLMGDGALVYFGWPQAHEDDAERAVRAGLELARAVAGLTTSAGERLAVRIGIATGPVLVGDLVGTGAAQEEAVVGETPNLAARLQTLAEPGTVVVAARTRRLLGGLFALADLGPVRLKGFAEAMSAFRVEGEGRTEGRFEALRGGRLTPLVGREHELAILLERWTWAKEGDGQVVLLAGEPGIGKSRLIRALRDELSGEPHVALSHFCSPYHTNSALHPIISQLERAAGLTPGDEAEVKLAKLEALLGQATPQLDEALPLLAVLLGIPTGGRYPALTMSPQRQKQRTLEVLIAQLAGLTRERPVLELYEDLHWVDPSTLELLDLLVERVRGLPVLVVLTYRPEFRPPWSGQAHVSALPLNRLGRRQGAAMVARLTGGKALPDEVLGQIVAKTDGVPLFVEELTKTMLESGLLRDAGERFVLSGPLAPLAIPTTLQDSLMARLDRLASVKEVAQVGAVIGREFTHELVAAASSLPEGQLGDALDELIAAGLIFRRGSPPAATYSFKHALVQDAAYDSLLRGKRQELHGRIARHLELDFPDVVATEPEVLAHHFGGAGEMEKAFHYRFEAGRRAAQRSAHLEAIQNLLKARDHLATLPEGEERVQRELDLLITLGPALSATKGFSAIEVEETYGRVRELCRMTGGADQRRRALQGLRVLYMVRGELAAAGELGEELLSQGEQEDSLSYQFEGHLALGIVDEFRGRVTSARHHLEQAIAMFDPVRFGDLVDQPTGNPAVTCLGHLASVLFLAGFPERSTERSREALAIARESSHPFSLAQALGSTGIASFFRRPFPDYDNAAALVALAEEQGFDFWKAWGLVLRGLAHTEEGRPEAGVNDLRQAFADAEAMGAPLVGISALTGLAATLGRTGELQQAFSVLADQRRLARRTGIGLHDASVRLLEGGLWMKRPDHDSAVVESCFRDALAIARRQESKILELRAATSLGFLWAERGERQRARKLVAPIYDWFTEGFDTADLKEAKALLDELQ